MTDRLRRATRALATALAMFLTTGLFPMPAAAQNNPAQFGPEWIGTWVLIAVDGVATDSRLTLDLNDPTRLSRQGPCNRWFATQSAPWPALDLGAIRSSRRACPELGAEHRYFLALTAMQKASLTPKGHLRLSAPDGRSLDYAKSR